MKEKLVREWKKVFENDLAHLVHELKDSIDEPCVLVIEGEMGAGKTTLSKEFLKDEDEDEQGSSPTYSILYETDQYLHADFYRLESSDEIIHLELEMYLEDKKVFLIEWGKKYIRRIEKEVPESFKFFILNIDIIDEARRNYQLYDIEDI